MALIQRIAASLGCLALVGGVMSAPPAPRLAVVISVDQMRADYWERFSPYWGSDGFRRFEAGAFFADCHYTYALTKTGPGHATMLSGALPQVHGIIANDWLQRPWPALESVNCVEDRAAPLVGLAPSAVRSPGGVVEAKRGRSPRPLLADTVGDQLKRRHGARAKVYGVADKDRAAILMAGREADGAYWVEEGRVVTSTYYRAELPAYLAQFNAEQRAERRFGQSWDRLLPAGTYDRVQGPDDAPGEADDFGLTRTFPKRIDGGGAEPGPAFYEAFDHSPWNNDLVAELARAVIVAENLGSDDGAPDLLAIGFAQTDKAGHAFGPDSHEVMDSYLRLDRTLAEFLAFLDERVGLEHCVIVLTADHGVAPLPERILAAGQGVPAGRIDGAALDRGVVAALEAAFGPAAEAERWVVRDGETYHLNPAVVARKGINPAEAEDVVRATLITQPGIADAATRTRLLDPAPLGRLGEAMRRSFHPRRSADVLFVLQPNFLVRARSGTTHGTPWAYDTHVPLAWFGVGVPAGRHAERVAVEDLAPSLARLLGVPAPSQAIGRPLF